MRLKKMAQNWGRIPLQKVCKSCSDIRQQRNRRRNGFNPKCLWHVRQAQKAANQRRRMRRRAAVSGYMLAVAPPPPPATRKIDREQRRQVIRQLRAERVRTAV